MSLDLWAQWGIAPKGRIPQLSQEDALLGTHFVTLCGYSDLMREFKFLNSWGADWGDAGYGSVSYEVFEAIWWEGWIFGPLTELEGPRKNRARLSERAWAIPEPCGGVLHCREILDVREGLVGWAFGLERKGVLHVEELFVKPQFRRTGHGARLIRSLARLAAYRNCDFRIWVSYADLAKNNLKSSIGSLIRLAWD